MSRMFEIEWTDFGVTVLVELLEEENPELCEQLWQGLPFEAAFAASMSSGESLSVPVPFELPRVAPEKLLLLPEQPPGTVLVLEGRILLKYGIMVEPFRLPGIGRIPNNELVKLRNVAIKVRDAYFFTKEINMATLRRKE